MRVAGWFQQALLLAALAQAGGCSGGGSSNGSDGGSSGGDDLGMSDGGIADAAMPGDDGSTGSSDMNSGADLAPDNNPNRLQLLVGGLGGPGFQDAAPDVARFDNPMGLALDGAGNLYVADSNNNAIRKVVLASGQVSTLAGGIASGSADGVGSAARFYQPVGLALDGSGSLYVAEYGGDTIRKIDLATASVTTIAGVGNMAGSSDGVGSAARFSQLRGLTYDGAGHLFATTGLAVRQIDLATATVSTLAGGTVTGSRDGVGSVAQFRTPAGILSDRGDNLYVADFDNNKIRQITVSTKTVSTLAGSDTAGTIDGRGAAARFNQPAGLALDGAGNLYVTEALNSDVRKIAIATADVTRLSGTPNAGTDDGQLVNATFWRPQGAVWGGGSTLLVADTMNNTIRMLDLGGGNVTTAAGKAREFVTDANRVGQGAAVRLSNAHSVASDGAGNLYVFGNGAVTKVVIATATASILAGKPGMRGTVDGVGMAANFYSEQGITADRKGNVFVIDGSAIRQVVIASGSVTTLVGNITTGGYVDGSSTTARLNFPDTLVSDGNDTIYVAEANGSTVRKVVVSTKTVSTLAGSATPGYTNGVGSAAQFSNPYGIACDGTSVYVTEFYQHWVRKIDLATTNVTTLAGSSLSGYTDANGAAARFRSPFGLAADGNGNVYVADKGNFMIRKIAASGAVTTAVGILNHKGVRLGGIPAPSSLNCPTGMVAIGSGQLAIYDSCEGTLLIANGI